MTRAYGHTWQAIVAPSRDLCCLPHHNAGTFIDFTIDTYRVVLYNHAGAALDTQLDMAKFAYRVAMLLSAMCVVVFGYFSLTTGDLIDRCGPSANNNATAEDQDQIDACSADDQVRAASFASLKAVALYGVVIFTVGASCIRVFRNTLRQKIKSA